MRKIKILIATFVLLVVLSMDLATLFTEGSTVKSDATQKEAFLDFKHLPHNVGCIASAVKGAVGEKLAKEGSKAVDKYADAVADATTKKVEEKIAEKTVEE